MLLLTRVKIQFADVSCPLCGGAFAVTRVQATGCSREDERNWVQEALLRHHAPHGSTDTASAHAPSFPLSGHPAPQRHRRAAVSPLPVLSLPAYGQPAALRYNG